MAGLDNIIGDSAVSVQTYSVGTDLPILTQVELADKDHVINQANQSGKKAGALVIVSLTTGTVHSLAVAQGGADTDTWVVSGGAATPTVITPS